MEFIEGGLSTFISTIDNIIYKTHWALIIYCTIDKKNDKMFLREITIKILFLVLYLRESLLEQIPQAQQLDLGLQSTNNRKLNIVLFIGDSANCSSVQSTGGNLECFGFKIQKKIKVKMFEFLYISPRADFVNTPNITSNIYRLAPPQIRITMILITMMLKKILARNV